MRPGTGYADRADDLNRLFLMLSPRRERVVGSGLMTVSELEHLGAMAPKLLEPLGRNDSAIAAAERLCDQAFTYFMQAWKKIVGRLRLVLDEQGKDIKLPSLYR